MIKFQFKMLRARYPELYDEAQEKIAAGVKRGDIIADWLTRLSMLEKSASEPADAPNDYDAAMAVMDALD